MMLSKEIIATAYQDIQDRISLGLADIDGKPFEEDLWNREGGGGGRSRILVEGNVFEKAGVNFSAVHGNLPENVKKAFKVDSDDFFATGVSLVIHPNNPWVPIIHMNIRYFEMSESVRWFGGGIDLTPHYVIPEDAKFFHQQLKNVCDQYHPNFYPKFKTWADDYFFIKHRQETRGIGGIFYDRLTPENTTLSFDNIYNFSLSLGYQFLPIYYELVNRNKNKSFTADDKQWQFQRRSRYAEFNLVYDSGTKFGLETNGRIESILMSLPPMAAWKYNYMPLKDSAEEQTLNLLKKGINWV